MFVRISMVALEGTANHVAKRAGQTERTDKRRHYAPPFWSSLVVGRRQCHNQQDTQLEEKGSSDEGGGRGEVRERKWKREGEI